MVAVQLVISRHYRMAGFRLVHSSQVSFTFETVRCSTHPACEDIWHQGLVVNLFSMVFRSGEIVLGFVVENLKNPLGQKC